jgi:hypothetical protein
MAYPLSMISRLSISACLAACLIVDDAHSKANSSQQNQSSNHSKPTEQPNSGPQMQRNSKVLRSSLTIKQVERVTGGQVIGVRQVNFQGRQLNMIKLKMPDGRIKVYGRLFDEHGRSVENIDSINAIVESEAPDTEP